MQGTQSWPKYIQTDRQTEPQLCVAFISLTSSNLIWLHLMWPIFISSDCKQSHFTTYCGDGCTKVATTSLRWALRDLHWLPVRQRIKYKLAMIVYKCRHGLAPVYLVNDCQAISAIASKRHLRSADRGILFVPRTTTTLGMMSFAVAGPPHIWNSLPAALRTAMLSPLAFARHLKSHLFDWDWQHVWGLFRTRSTNLRIIIIIIRPSLLRLWPVTVHSVYMKWGQMRWNEMGDWNTPLNYKKNSGCNLKRLVTVKVKVYMYSTLHPASTPRELTCHIGSHSVTCHLAQVALPSLPQPSHSVTCHPAQVALPSLPQPITAGTRVSDPREMQD